jgi:2,4-dichlorophenol 6-monooxygenase
LRSANLPQVRLEPILRQLAETKNPGGILYNIEVIQIHEEEGSVVVVGTDATDSQLLYRCQYLIAADGGRTIGPRVGINMLGQTDLADMVSVHFSADLSAFWDDRNILCYLLNESPGSGPEKGVIVPTGPTWGRYSEEWVFHVGFDHNDPQRFQEDVLIARVRNLLKTPDVDMKIHKISHYAIERVLADTYQKGNIFVVGDAAHRQPPTTGLGLNTGLEDCLNLAWKLALVLRHGVSPSVLNTYESERRAVGEKNCDWGLFTFNNSVLIDAATGLINPHMKANQDRLRFLFTDSAQARSLRAQLARIVSSQDVELSTHGIELGFQYDHGFFIAEGGPSPLSDPLGIQYFPTTKPGNRLPHAWIQGKDGIMSTHDLVGAHGAFGLIIDKDGAPWVSAARSASRIHGINISIAEIDGGCQYQDYDGQWDQVKEIGTGGALLVRPDNIVAWRSKHKSQSTGQELVTALDYLFTHDFETFGGKRSTKL